MAFSCDPKRISPVWQLRLMGLVLLILGIVEYLVGIAENYIIAAKSQSDEVMYQYSTNILNIFASIFIFVNTGFLTMITVRESAANDVSSAKRKNISKIFHFGVIAGLASGTLVMIVLLVFRVELFEMMRQGALADEAKRFFNIRAPFIPFEYLGNVLMSVLMGLMQVQQMLIASLVTNGLYLPVLLLLLKFMDDTIAAIALANAFSIVLNIIAFVVIFTSKSFRTRYEIFDFGIYKGSNQRSPLLTDSFPGTEEQQDETSVAELGKASLLLFSKNFFSTVSDVIGMVLLATTLSQNQFIAYNVLGNTIQFSSFASFYNTVINIFGPRLIAAGEKTRYKGIFTKAHINMVLLGGLSYLLFFVLHTDHISIKNLTDATDRAEVTDLLKPIWPIWAINIMFTMWANLYDTALINFQKYTVLGVMGVLKSVCITIPIIIISALKYHSLIGIPLSGLISNIIETSVCAFLFHFKYFKSITNTEKPLSTIQYN